MTSGSGSALEAGQRDGRSDVALHGGNLAAARAAFPGAPEPWLDLSTGISPISYPLSDLPATAFTRLPEPARLMDLRLLAARTYGAPSQDHVVAAPGTQSLLPRLAALVPPGRAAILGPTYEEHARAAAQAGHRVETISRLDALADASYAVIVNPNNPDGRLLTRGDLLELRGRMAREALLVVDEAFMEAAPRDESLCASAAEAGIVVLRSFGKFHGLAGIRLGFAVASVATVARLETGLGPWAVSGPALEYGVAALSDAGWRETHRARLDALCRRLDRSLSGAGVEFVGGTSLFRLVRHADAAGLFRVLGRAGILTRPFATSPDLLRFGLPGDDQAFERLDAALGAWENEAGKDAA